MNSLSLFCQVSSPLYFVHALEFNLCTFLVFFHACVQLTGLVSECTWHSVVVCWQVISKYLYHCCQYESPATATY